MARAIVVRWEGAESAFGFTKVEREKLYGKKERVVVDENGRECQAAWLTPDGAVLVPMGGTAHVWMDERWDARDIADRVAVDEANQPLVPVPSTLGVAQDLVEVDAQRVLDHVTVNLYELSLETVSPTLEAALRAGRIFELPFNYRDGHDQEAMFLLSNDEGLFAIVGRPTEFEMVARDTVIDDADAGPDELEGDLDFSMM
jgi:hypothetical protein